MTEVIAAKSSPEQKNDQSDGSGNVTTDQNGATSGQENNDLPEETSSIDGAKSDLNVRVEGESQNTPTDCNTTSFDYNFIDSDDCDDNTTGDPKRQSDNDFVDSDDSGCSRGNNNPDWEINDSDNNESNNPRIVHDSVDSRNTNDESEKNINEDDTSSSDDTNCIPSQETSNDDGEFNRTEDVPEECDEEKKDEGSSDEENNCIPSQATFTNGGEHSKTNHVYVAGPSNERKDQIKMGTKTKAERKQIYTVPLKKIRKF